MKPCSEVSQPLKFLCLCCCTSNCLVSAVWRLPQVPEHKAASEARPWAEFLHQWHLLSLWPWCLPMKPLSVCLWWFLTCHHRCKRLLRIKRAFQSARLQVLGIQSECCFLRINTYSLAWCGCREKTQTVLLTYEVLDHVAVMSGLMFTVHVSVLYLDYYFFFFFTHCFNVSHSLHSKK